MEYKIHPQQESFEWKMPDTKKRMLSQDQVNQYDEKGFVVLENVLDLDVLSEVEKVIDGFEAERTKALKEQFEDGKSFIDRADEITFTIHLVQKSEVLKKFTQSEFFRKVTNDLMGQNVRLYWDQAVYKKPGNPSPFPWHQDNGYTYVVPSQYLTCWIPLVDATLENGCPHVVPGIHKIGTLAHEHTDIGMNCFQGEAEGVLAAPVKKGGVVCFSSLTPHATGPNLTDGVRKAYIIQFAHDGAIFKYQHESGKVFEIPCSDPTRQYPILIDGREPTAEEMVGDAQDQEALAEQFAALMGGK